jgi:hydroxymethylbilane synthase
LSDSTPITVRIASRASQLAMWQARHVSALIRGVRPGAVVEIVNVTTSGDANQTDSLRSFGGMGVFTREVQRAVLDGRADLAVHSLKDLPTTAAPGLVLAGVPEREDTSDAFVAPAREGGPRSFRELPAGARVGTGSLRRQSQLLHVRPDLVLDEVRGNVETRLRKLDDGEYAGLVLAVAGLTRLGVAERITESLGPPLMFGAVGQGALGLECRESDDATRALLGELTDPAAWARVTAERALLAALRAGCHAPVGAATRVVGDHLSLEGVVLSPDGTERLVSTGAARVEAAEELGRAVAEQLVLQGAGRLISGV